MLIIVRSYRSQGACTLTPAHEACTALIRILDVLAKLRTPNCEHSRGKLLVEAMAICTDGIASILLLVLLLPILLLLLVSLFLRLPFVVGDSTVAMSAHIFTAKGGLAKRKLGKCLPRAPSSHRRHLKNQ